MKLLTGLYTPEDGHILLNDKPVDDESREAYQAAFFRAVFSDFYLFEQMLGLVDPEHDRQAEEYLEQLGCHTKCKSLKESFQPRTSPRDSANGLDCLRHIWKIGQFMSLTNGPPTRTHNSKLFCEQLPARTAGQGKTVFVITHDDRYYHLADRVIKLDDGQIVSDIINTQLATLEAAGD